MAGLAAYVLGAGKVGEVGRLVFVVGLLVTLWALTTGALGRTFQ